MKVLYVTYENVYKTAILQAMVVKPLSMLTERYGVKFVVTSSIKHGECDEVYLANKTMKLNKKNIEIVEFKKKLTSKQSIITFFRDLLPMIIFSVRQARQSDVIHCRSYGGALIGLIAYYLTRKPYIFDMRGLLPEETVEVGKISSVSIKFRLMKMVEKLLIKKAACVFTVSEKFKAYVENNFKVKKVININNPTDFSMYEIANNKNENGCVNFIYSGSMQVWHMPEETIKLYGEIEAIYKGKVFLYFCTNDKGKAENIFNKYGIPKSAYTIQTVPYNDMPKYYSKCNLAFCLIRNSFSKSVCFPVKFSEYIASELYVITNRGIGDLEDIVSTYNCGVLLDDVNDIISNVDTISLIINKIIANKNKMYDRDDLRFLDWGESSINKIHDVYKSISST